MIDLERETIAVDLTYPLRWRVNSILYGTHSATGHSDSGNFKGFQPFSRHPDIRRLDLRRSLRDPFAQWWVKDYEPRAPVQIYLLVDISASMQAGQGQRQLDLATRICTAVAHAAYRNGDALSFFACGSDIEFQSATSNQRATASSARMIRSWLLKASAQAQNANGLALAARRLKHSRSLVFLLSDFMFSLEQCRQLLGPLRRHDVVPIVLDTYQLNARSAWGLSTWYDAETGQSKLLFMRPSLFKRWHAQQQQREQEINQLFHRFGMSPFRPGEIFNAQLLARHLMER